MSLRARFLGLIDVVLRIPPLFLLDEILKMNVFFENSSQQENSFNETLADEISSNSTETFTASIDFYGLSWILLKFILFLLGKSITLKTNLAFGSEKKKNLEKRKRSNIQ